MASTELDIFQEEKKRFLECFDEYETVTKTAEALGIERRLHFRWLRSDPEYRDQFQICLKLLKQRWIDEVLLIARDIDVKTKDRLFAYALAINNVESAQHDPKIPAITELFMRKIKKYGQVHEKITEGMVVEGGVREIEN